VGHEMAEQVAMALSGVTPPYAVNAPAVAADIAPRLRPYVELSRLSAAGEAMMFVSVDERVSAATMDRLQRNDAILEARLVELP